MKTHGLMLSRVLVILSLLATLCVTGCKQEEPPFQWGGGGGGGGSSSDDDDDAAGIPDETWAIARIEVTRSDVEGTTGAVIRAVASWFPHQRVEMRPEPPNDVDTCHGGSSSSGQYMIPDSTWDIGNMSLVMADDEYGISFQDGYFQDVQSGGQVTVEWLGGDDLNQITILVTRSSGDSLFWVSCRVQDDGEFTLSAGDLEVLPEGTALLDVRREMRADIEVDDLPGVVIGISSASTGISIAAAGDDDDSAP